jgi:type III secretion protein L
MTLIKAADPMARRARPPEIRLSALPAAPDPPMTAAERAALERVLDELSEHMRTLETKNASLEDSLMAARAEAAQAALGLDAAVAEAKVSAHEDGLAAGAAAKAEALQQLDAGLARATERLAADLQGLETLAVSLAKAALAKIFDDHDGLADRVVQLIRRQLADLERGALLGVEVSERDFPDSESLQHLSRTAGLSGVEIRALAGLEPGGCRLRLRLGELDVGVGQQWARLSALLDGALAPNALAEEIGP